MTATPLTLDPEIQGLIQEIAATPNSTLLRKPRSDVFHSPYDRVRPTTPGLTTAERHLVRVHAEELAYWLRVACVMGLLSRRGVRDCYEAVTHTERAAQQTSEDLAGALRRTTQRFDALDQGNRMGEELAQLVEGGPTFGSVPLAAHLSRRLQPSREAEVYCAVYHLESGEEQSAALILNRAAAQTSSDQVASMSLSNLGRLHFRGGRFLDSARAYESACRLGAPPRPTPLIGWFVSSLAAHDLGQAELSAAALDEIVPEDHPRLDRFIRVNSRALKGSRPAVAPTLMGRLGATSTRIFDAL